MFVTLNYLKEWTGCDIEPGWLEKHLTQLGLEVELQQPFRRPETLFGAKVLSCRYLEPSLFICDLEDSSGKHLSVNSPISLPHESFVAVIPHKSSKYALATPALLGWGQLNYPLKMSGFTGFDKYWQLDDILFEFSITPNRGDCLSYMGLISEIYLAKLKFFKRADFINQWLTRFQVTLKGQCPISVDVKDDMATAYHCAMVELPQALAIPQWLEVFLIKHNMNPKNFGAAVTNVMMMIFGQPLHAFAYESMKKNKISVESTTFASGTKFLDGTTFSDQHQLIGVVDGNKHPLAVAGVVGTVDSAVDDTTCKFVFESANFSMSAVRQARRSALVTDSLLRFERGVCPLLTKDVLLIALGIIQSACPNALCSNLSSFTSHQPQKLEAITLSRKKLESLLGIEIKPELLEDIMTALGGHFDGNTLSMSVPPHRYDLSSSCDLVEEVMRLYHCIDLHQVSRTFPAFNVQTTKDHFASHLVSRGFFEVMTFGFSSYEKCHSYSGSDEQLLIVDNPISSQLSTMNTSLLPNLLDVASKARAHQQDKVRLFESAWVFHRDLENFQQESLAALMLEHSSKSWHESKKTLSLFYTLKSLMIDFAQRLRRHFYFVSCEHRFFEKDFCWEIYENQEVIGLMGVVSLDLCQRYDWPQPSWVVEIHPQGLDKDPYSFKPFSRYPLVTRDLSFVIDSDQSVDFLISFIQTTDRGELGQLNLSVFDYYKDNSSAILKKSVGLRLTFQSIDRTLNDGEVDVYMQNLLGSIESSLGLQVKSSS